MLKGIISTAGILATFVAHAQPAEDCAKMASRWSDVFTNAPAVESMTALFQPNALVFGTNSKDLGTTTGDVIAYFTPIYARKVRTKNSIKSQQAIQIADSVWVIAGLYEFTNFAADGAQSTAPARFHFVVVRQGSECKIAAFNSSRIPG